VTPLWVVRCPDGGSHRGGESEENAPAAFIGLLEGRNFGKLVVRVAEA